MGKRKPQPVQMKQKEKPMLINVNELQIKAGHQVHASFRTGKYMSEKDRPRRKRWSIEDE